MARIGGRSPWIAWPVAILCVGVVVLLVGLALPLVPASVDWAGSALRGTIFAPSAPSDAAGSGSSDSASSGSAASTSECRGLYTDRLWSELTARNGGDPVRDTAAPTMAAESVAAGLSPVVLQTCTWTGASTGAITTTVSQVSETATAIAESALVSQGYTCARSDSGVQCSVTNGDVTEEHLLRGDVWVATQFTAWHPSLYSERVAEHVWSD